MAFDHYVVRKVEDSDPELFFLAWSADKPGTVFLRTIQRRTGAPGSIGDNDRFADSTGAAEFRINSDSKYLGTLHSSLTYAGLRLSRDSPISLARSTDRQPLISRVSGYRTGGRPVRYRTQKPRRFLRLQPSYLPRSIRLVPSFRLR